MPATLRVEDTAAALNKAVVIGAVRVDSYRRAALEARKATEELLPGVGVVPEREHFGICFGRENGGDLTPGSS